MMPEGIESCFTRIVSDQFLLLMPCEYGEEETCEIIKRINREFVRRMNLRFPQSNMIIRTGVYKIRTDCPGVSSAIDAAIMQESRLTAIMGNVWLFMMRD